MRIQRITVAALAAAMSFCVAVGAQTSTPAEPEYVNQFFVLGSNGQLTPLEGEPMHHAIKHNSIPIIKAGIEGRQDVQGGLSSPVHVGPGADFVVKMMTGAIDPATMMHLIQFKVDKQGRYYVTGKTEGYIFTNGKSSGPQGDAAQLTIKKYGQGSLEVQATEPLPVGEYAFITNGMIADCFSVDPGISDNVPAKPPAPVARAAAPPPPSHPSADVVDLAPAAPGYPPIHASHPAMDGCWWVPFLSHNFGFEAAIQTCGKKETTTLVFENEKGIVIKYQGNAAIEPEQICVVETKPAEQTIEAAIKQKHIMTLSVPAARSSCRAKCDPVNSAGTLNCNVEAVGPYSKLKKFNTEDDRGESPCPGLTTDDAIARFFLYRPSESKTKYLFFQEDDNGIVFDHESLHFATTP